MSVVGRSRLFVIPFDDFGFRDEISRWNILIISWKILIRGSPNRERCCPFPGFLLDCFFFFCRTEFEDKLIPKRRLLVGFSIIFFSNLKMIAVIDGHLLDVFEDERWRAKHFLSFA